MDPNGHLLVGLAGADANVPLLRYAGMVARFNCRAAPKLSRQDGRPGEVTTTCPELCGALPVPVGTLGGALADPPVTSGTASEVRFVRIVPPWTDLSGPAGHRRLLHQLRGMVRRHFPAEHCPAAPQCDVLKGPLAKRLIDFAIEQESDLILVSRPSNRSGRSALTSLVLRAPCSVWVIPEEAPARISRILAPIDFSEGAADTLRVALTLARRSAARCLPLHVYFHDAVVTHPGYDALLRQQKHDAYEQLISGLDREGVTVDPLLLVEGAKTSHVIQRVADKHTVDLIVMATRGRTRAAALLLSSVAGQMADKTRVPLVVVKDLGAPLGLLQALTDPKWPQQNEPRFN